MSSYVVRGKPLPSGAGSFRMVRRVSVVTLMMPCGRVFETVNGMACPSIITKVVSPSTRVRSMRRFLTKFVKSSSTFSRMSTGARVSESAVLTLAGLTTTYSFMATPQFLRVKPSMRMMSRFWSSLYAGHAMALVVRLFTISITSPALIPSFCIVRWSMRAIPLPTSLCRASPTRSCTSLITSISK